MDTDANGTIEFSEFAKFYKASTIAEKQKIRALRAHSELRRRLDNGELSPEEFKKMMCLDTEFRAGEKFLTKL